MFPLTEATPNGFEEEVPFTLLLGFKELFLLSLILFLGFTGFSLCFEKIYNPPLYEERIPNVTVYTADIDDPYMTVANSSYNVTKVK